MITPRLALVVAVAAFAFACARTGNDGPHPVGTSTFQSQPPGGGVAAADGRVSTGVTGAPGAVAPGAASNDASPGSTSGAARTVEEADVYRRSGDLLLVLNGYRGLQVLDLADPTRPGLLSRVPMTGTPVDLYLRGTTALVLVSDAFAYLPMADQGARPERTSRLLAVDLGDPAHPVVVGDLAIEGQVETSRLVGDVLYVVSHRWSWYGWTGVVALGSDRAVAVPAPGGPVKGPVAGADSIFVASFQVGDPAHPSQVDRLELSAVGWSVHAHATAARTTLAFAGWQSDTAKGYGPVTWFAPVDTSDASGQLEAGAPFSAEGLVADRWAMDFDGATGLFRAVLASGWNQGATLRTWTSPTPAQATPLSTLTVQVDESLTAARFDGPRVYLVTAKAMDPLWVVDASDPAAPRLAGHLAMPGQLDFIEPRGDRLLALGRTSEAGVAWQLAASLIDVSNLAKPLLLSRVTFGGQYGWTGASTDDLRKAFLVFDPPPASLGLVLVPAQGWDAARWTFVGGTQLIDYRRDALTLRGLLAHPGAPKRAFPLDAGGTRLAAFSDQVLQVIDASDRAAPAELARLDLARPVQAVAPLATALVELCGDWSRGDTELVATPLRDPEATRPLARLRLPAPQARMFPVGNVVWLLAEDGATGQGWLQAVDFTDPLHPAARGKLALTQGESKVASGGWWGWGGEAVLAGRVLAIHHLSWIACVTAPCDPLDELRLYDLADPDHPRLASVLAIPGSAWSWGLLASGPYLWLTHFEWGPEQYRVSDGTAWGRYYLDRIDVTDPAAPRLRAKVNVPGVLFAAAEDGRSVYTLEPTWTGQAVDTWLHGLHLDGDGAVLDGSVSLPGYPSGAARAAGHAYVATSDWSAGGSRLRLQAVDLAALRLTSTQAVEGAWAWVSKAGGGKLFLQSGWNDQGVLVYDLADPARPAFQRFARTDGWVQDVVVGDGVAYLPSGLYGVPMIDLAE